MSKTILAIVGLPGAGKTEATQYVMQKTGWPKKYFGDATFEEMQRQGLEVNEVNERKVREELRAKYGMGAYAILCLPKVRELFEKSSVIIESLYSWEEYTAVAKEFGDDFKVMAIFASPKTRIKRLSNRPARPLTAEEVQKRDYSQIENLHQAGPIARADFMIINEGSIEEMKRQIDGILKNF